MHTAPAHKKLENRKGNTLSAECLQGRERLASPLRPLSRGKAAARCARRKPA